MHVKLFCANICIHVHSHSAHIHSLLSTVLMRNMSSSVWHFDICFTQCLACGNGETTNHALWRVEEEQGVDSQSSPSTHCTTEQTVHQMFQRQWCVTLIHALAQIHTKCKYTTSQHPLASLRTHVFTGKFHNNVNYVLIRQYIVVLCIPVSLCMQFVVCANKHQICCKYTCCQVCVIIVPVLSATIPCIQKCQLY